MRVFADKAAGYGIPGITIDGTDADEIAAAVAWAVERARAGLGPALIELWRCACADMPITTTCSISAATRRRRGSIRAPPIPGMDREAYAYWSACDPIGRYAERLRADGVLREGDLDQWKTEITALVEREARR